MYLCVMCLLGVIFLITPLVDGEDDPPDLHYIPPQEANEDERFTLDFSAFVYWWSPEGNLTYTDDSPLVETDPITGLMVWDVPTNEDVGEHFITVTVTDENGTFVQQEIKITVYDGSCGPDFPNFGVQELAQGIPYEMDLSISEDEGSSDHITGLTYSNDHHELFVIDPVTGIISFTPTNEQVGKWSVTITAMETDESTYSSMFDFTIANINDPPMIEPLGSRSMTEGEPFNVQLVAHDADMDVRLVDGNLIVDPNENLTWSGGLPGHEVDPVSGLFEYTPTNDDAGNRTLRVTFNVTDAQGASDSIQVIFRVRNVVQAPTVEIVGLVEGQRVDRNLKYELEARTVDEWGEPWGVQFLWYVDGDYLGNGRTFTWKPPYDGNGQANVKLIVVNETNERVEVSVGVTIYHRDYGNPAMEYLFMGMGLLLLAVGIFMIGWLMVRRMASKGWYGNDLKGGSGEDRPN
jgi:hypothetical protein